MTELVYQAETEGLIVRVRPSFLADRSEPAAGRWTWAYHVEIVNASAETVTLLSRHWIITDGLGRVEEVQGPGVVGQQPTLAPGASYVYASGCSLSTPSGSMRGTYALVRTSGEAVTAVIPHFSLDVPEARRVVN